MIELLLVGILAIVFTHECTNLRKLLEQVLKCIIVLYGTQRTWEAQMKSHYIEVGLAGEQIKGQLEGHLRSR